MIVFSSIIHHEIISIKLWKSLKLVTDSLTICSLVHIAMIKLMWNLKMGTYILFDLFELLKSSPHLVHYYLAIYYFRIVRLHQRYVCHYVTTKLQHPVEVNIYFIKLCTYVLAIESIQWYVCCWTGNYLQREW